MPKRTQEATRTASSGQQWVWVWTPQHHKWLTQHETKAVLKSRNSYWYFEEKKPSHHHRTQWTGKKNEAAELAATISWISRCLKNWYREPALKFWFNIGMGEKRQWENHHCQSSDIHKSWPHRIVLLKIVRLISTGTERQNETQLKA